jgi:hypothetical protein
MRFLVMQFSPVSHSSSRSEYSPWHPFVKYPQFMLSFRVRDKASHPYKTTGKVIVFLSFDLYVLVETYSNLKYTKSYNSVVGTPALYFGGPMFQS